MYIIDDDYQALCELFRIAQGVQDGADSVLHSETLKKAAKLQEKMKKQVSEQRFRKEVRRLVRHYKKINLQP